MPITNNMQIKVTVLIIKNLEVRTVYLSAFFCEYGHRRNVVHSNYQFVCFLWTLPDCSRQRLRSACAPPLIKIFPIA